MTKSEFAWTQADHIVADFEGELSEDGTRLYAECQRLESENRKLTLSLSEGTYRWRDRTDTPTAPGYYVSYSPEFPYERGVVLWDGDAWRWTDEDRSVMKPGDNYPFTHWMPLPEAPK